MSWLQGIVSTSESNLSAVSVKRERLRAELRDNLQRRRGELEAALLSLGDFGRSSLEGRDIKRRGKKGKAVETQQGSSTDAGEQGTLRLDLEKAVEVVQELEAEVDEVDSSIQRISVQVRPSVLLIVQSSPTFSLPVRMLRRRS